MSTTIYGKTNKTQLFQAMNGMTNSLRDLQDGAELTITAAAVNIPDDPDALTELFLVTAGDGIFSTTSGTVRDTFLRAVEFFGTHELKVRKISGKSKAGRAYINIEVIGGNYNDLE